MIEGAVVIHNVEIIDDTGRAAKINSNWDEMGIPAISFGQYEDGNCTWDESGEIALSWDMLRKMGNEMLALCERFSK